MEELQVIETTSGRQFKPWVDADKLQEIVSNPASVTAITSEIASGKAAIAQAINTKGGSASATESFAELAEAVEGIPNFSDMVKLASIIAGGNYNKNALQGHNENVKYGKTEIVDILGAFEKINVDYCFQYWDLLQEVNFPLLTSIGSSAFKNCTSLQEVDMPNLFTLGSYGFAGCSALQEVNMPNLVNLDGYGFASCSALQEVNMPNLVNLDGYGFVGCSALQEVNMPNLVNLGEVAFHYCQALRNMILGTLSTLREPFYAPKLNLRNITIGQDTNINLPFQQWTATNVIAEGQSGIDELNANLQTNLISKLYQGGGKILRLGAALYDVTTQETRGMVTAKGWTLQRG